MKKKKEKSPIDNFVEHVKNQVMQQVMVDIMYELLLRLALELDKEEAEGIYNQLVAGVVFPEYTMLPTIGGGMKDDKESKN